MLHKENAKKALDCSKSKFTEKEGGGLPLTNFARAPWKEFMFLPGLLTTWWKERWVVDTSLD